MALMLGACVSMPEFEAAEDDPPPVTPRYSLAELPHPQLVNELKFNGSPIGFTDLVVEPLPQHLYRIRSQAFMNLSLLGVKKVSVINAISIVDARLQLRSFDYRYWVDGVRSHVRGRVDGLQLTADVTRNGITDTHSLTLVRPVLPSAALPLYPVINGLEIGSVYNFSIFDGDAIRVKVVEQTVEGYEQSNEADVNTFRILSNVQGQAVRTWTSADARPLFEASMGGMFTATYADATATRLAMLDAVFDEHDDALEFRRVQTEGQLAAVVDAFAAELLIDGGDFDLELPSDHRQYCEREGMSWRCEVAAQPLDMRVDGIAYADSPTWLSDPPLGEDVNAELSTILTTIGGESESSRVRLELLLAWLRTEIELEHDGPTELDTILVEHRANTRGQLALMVALARRAGIPARVNAGLAYSAEQQSFVYRLWMQCWVDGLWRAIDPVRDVEPVDASYVAIGVGEVDHAALSVLPSFGRMAVRLVRLHE
ncbi:MAG: hypothetical protein CMO26_13820 [Thiotrichales bacterium]|nr:hypothetical protein [Thiotrichales bacterium]